MFLQTDSLRRRGFTLLEVMLAVLVLAMITFTLYRFVIVDLTAIRAATDFTNQEASVQSLVAVLDAEFRNLPPREDAALLGQAHQFNEKASDEVSWLTQAGNGLFTQEADGPWKATLELRPQEKSSSFVLGIVRELPNNTDRKAEHWLPLLPNVDALEIRYFDHRLNAWLEKWSDHGTRPGLVRIRIWRESQPVPFEAVIGIPPTSGGPGNPT